MKGTAMRRLLLILALVATAFLPVHATAQTATPTCFGEPATVVGTRGPDDLTGDVVVGLAGSDDISGRLVCGGKDADHYLDGFRVDAGPGDDREIYSSGDLIIGGSGHDKFWDIGYQVRQVWRGGPGNDTFVSTYGDDVFYGGIGDDRVTDEEGRGRGADRLYGGDGNDSLIGMDGRDEIPAVPDFIDGGPGFDTCVVDSGDRVLNCEDVTVAG
jgi:Ca2+-binding RTX toxin-like protein